MVFHIHIHIYIYIGDDTKFFERLMIMSMVDDVPMKIVIMIQCIVLLSAVDVDIYVLCVETNVNNGEIKGASMNCIPKSIYPSE